VFLVKLANNVKTLFCCTIATRRAADMCTYKTLLIHMSEPLALDDDIQRFGIYVFLPSKKNTRNERAPNECVITSRNKFNEVRV
jgi:hypothetical protein